MPAIALSEVREGDQVKLLLSGLGDTRRLLTKMGLLMVARAQQAFRDQRQYGGQPWPARAVPNVAGIVADLAKGSGVKSRRFDPRPAVVDTGLLRQSITYRVASDSVQVGSVLPYFQLHQEGGTSRQTITDTVRTGLAKFLKQRPDLRSRLGFLFNVKELVTNVQKRPSVGVTPQLRADLHEVLVRAVLGQEV